MGAKEIDLKGQKFNKLTAIKYAGNEKWVFECECGKEVIKTASDVKRGKTVSCSRICTTGNPSKHPLYHTWDGIKKRCYQENATGYKNYGGRGIKMCDEWKNSFWTFVSDMGDKPFSACSIERLDTNKDYCKDNCIWATASEQAKNRRNNIYITYQNEVYTLFAICKLLGFTHSTVYWRLKKSELSPQEYFDKYLLTQSKSLSMKTTTYCKLMFIFFGIVLISFIGKLMTRRSPELHAPTKEEVIQHNYDEPAAFVEDSTIPEYKRAYYDRLYDY